MTHTDTRNERIRLMMKLVGEQGMVKFEKLVAQISFNTSCSELKAKEYIRIAVLADQLKIEDGWVELKQKKESALPSA